MYLRSSQIETRGRGRHGGGAELSDSLDEAPSQHPHVFTNLEALPTPSHELFDGGLADQIIDHS